MGVAHPMHNSELDEVYHFFFNLGSFCVLYMKLELGYTEITWFQALLLHIFIIYFVQLTNHGIFTLVLPHLLEMISHILHHVFELH
ncbi:hypothetical protein ACJX0J_020761, partial [Zea mays]